MDPKLLDKINQAFVLVEPEAYLILDQEEDDEGEDLKKDLAIILISGALFGLSFLLRDQVKFAVLIVAYLLVGHRVLLTAFNNIKRGQWTDEQFLMSLASLGAIAIGDPSEAVAVMIFYSVGELLQDLAVDRSRASIAGLMNIQAEVAHLIQEDSQVKDIDPSQAIIGDILQVRPGEKIPVDGRISKGSSSLDSSALTGESLPVDVSQGSEVLSGSINLSSSFEMVVEKPYEDSAVAKILQLMEESSTRKAVTEQFITRFARYYTPTVVILAVLLALLPPLVLGQEFSKWIYRSLVFLVASCPCALMVSIPLGFFSALGKASKEGILIKGGNFVEKASKIKKFVFDKTGTLTYGKFSVNSIDPAPGVSQDELLELAAKAESMASHPIGISIVEKYGKDISHPDSIEDITGMGIVAKDGTDTILAGNKKMMDKYGIDFTEELRPGTIVYLAKNQKFIGSILISDSTKANALQSLEELRLEGVQSFSLLSGDGDRIVAEVAKELSIEDARGSLLPQDKVAAMEKILKEKDGEVAYVGDGINDAPVLMLADIGIAMGGVGSDAAIEAADVVIMKDDLSRLPILVRLAHRSMRIIYQNIFIALFIKFAVLILGALGYANMWLAVIADVGVALVCILNAVRILR